MQGAQLAVDGRGPGGLRGHFMVAVGDGPLDRLVGDTQVPGLGSSEELLSIIGRTAKLTFHAVLGVDDEARALRAAARARALRVAGLGALIALGGWALTVIGVRLLG